MMVNRIKLLAGLSLLGLLSACGQDMNDLQKYVSSVKERKPAAIEPIPAIKPYVRFVYPGHELDPFDATSVRSAKVEQPESSVVLDENRVLEYLEGFPLDSLKMVGTVFKDGQLWALVKVPEGAVHRVKPGNYIGQNHGKVTGVEETSMALLEIVENGFGGYKENPNTMKLSSIND